jgi:hypothetical protein
MIANGIQINLMLSKKLFHKCVRENQLMKSNAVQAWQLLASSRLCPGYIRLDKHLGENIWRIHVAWMARSSRKVAHTYAIW